ncbi:hypothetical protein FB451DRAFT_310296 [Mycena latifolia]|nr:hypothetical protein FB451DRAFT_310296 [Mycena latifolia]
MPVPSMPSPPMLKLEQTPFFVPPIQTDLYGRNAPYSPNSTPIADPVINISPPSEPTPVARTKPAPPRPPHLTLGTSASATAPQLPVPKTAPESRPASWVSVSSGGSESLAASPLFDKAIFDAFPSVPEMPSPQQQQSAHLRMRSGSYARAHSLHSTGTNSPAESMPPSNSMPAFAPEPLMGRLYVAAEAQRRVNPLP